MAEGKKSFVLYCDLIHTVKKMKQKDKAELFDHILAYVNDLDPKTSNTTVELVFEPIKQQLKRDLQKWKSLQKRNSENGKLGGRPKTQNNPNNPDGLEETQENPEKPKKAVNVTVTDTVNESDNDEEYAHDFFPGQKSVFTSADLTGSSHLDVIALEMGLTKHHVSNMLENFHKARRMDGKTYESMVDLRSHFVNYCNKIKATAGATTMKSSKSINGKPL
jgi:hypothetical protein